MFRSPRSAPFELTETASFKQCLDFYSQKVGLSERKLAHCARINQQWLNKISNGQIEKLDVETLVRLCLVLGLTEKESVDLMARRERALSPASPLHKAYRELFHIYLKKDINYTGGEADLEKILDEADEYLEKHGFAPFLYKNQ